MSIGNVRAGCPTCGPIEVAAAEITILSCLDTSTNLYRFRCPRCGSAIVKDAGPALVTLLLRAGANVSHWPEPSNDQAPPGDDRPDPTLPAITAEELDAFHEALEGLPTAGEQ